MASSSDTGAQARRKTLHEAVAQLERQQGSLLDVYLAEVIGREEFVRKRIELEQMSNGLKQELKQVEAQVQQQLNVAKLAEGTKAFCERIQPTLEHLSFAQRRQLVELIIDRVVINDGQVEIRYVIPTSPKGEHVPFCYLHKDYRARPSRHQAEILFKEELCDLGVGQLRFRIPLLPGV